MNTGNEYGQYCPLSMATQILGTRWTILVIREVLLGHTSFNDISRGVPLMSRTLLSDRLKQLELVGLLTKQEHGRGKAVTYLPTSACEALGPILYDIAAWGQEWIATEPSLEDVDTDVLMWDMRANVEARADFPERFVVRFRFPDAPENKTLHWLVFENNEVDICYIDPGYEVDVYIEATARDMVRIWMGWLELEKAKAEQRIQIDGPPQFTDDIKSWLKFSGLSAVDKQPAKERVFRDMVAE